MFKSSLSLPVGEGGLLHITTTLIGRLPLSSRNQIPLKNKQMVAGCERIALLYSSCCLHEARYELLSGSKKLFYCPADLRYRPTCLRRRTSDLRFLPCCLNNRDLSFALPNNLIAFPSELFAEAAE